MIAVIDLTVFNAVTRQEEVLHLTSGSHFIEGSTQYLPVVSELPSYTESIFTSGAADGELSAARGNFKISNTSGEFDYLERYGTSGRRVVIRVAEDENASAVLEYLGVITYAIFELNEVTFHLSNSLEDLNVSAIKESFKGTNIGPEGLEGSEKEGKGSFKPFIYGRVFNVPLVQVNASLLIYACNYNLAGERAPISRVWAVRVKGGAIKLSADFATAALLIAAAVPDGQYATCLLEGLVKLGVVPVGQVCADIDETTPDSCTAAAVVGRVLTGRAGKVEGVDFDTSTLLSISSFNSCPVGIFVSDQSTVLSVLSQVLNSVGGWLASNPTGPYYFGVFNLSSFASTSGFLVTEDSFVLNSMAKLPTGVADRNIPSYKSEVSHTRNWAPQTDVLVSVESALANRLSEEYLTDSLESLEVLEVHPKSETTRHLTLLQESRKAYVRSSDLKTNSLSVDFFDLDGVTQAWNLIQVSGTGGSIAFNGVSCQVEAGTGVARASQVFDAKKAGLVEGVWTVRVQQISGTGQLRVLEGATLRGESPVLSGAGFHTLTVVISGSSAQATLQVVSTTATTSFVDLTIEEAMSNDTPVKELQRRFDISKSLQSRVSLEVKPDSEHSLSLGQQVVLQFGRYFHESGKSYLVVEKTTLLGESTRKVTLWRVENE